MARTTSFIADLGLLVRPSVSKPEPYVPRLNDVNDVTQILQASHARNNPPYVLAVLKSYVRPRVGARRRPRLEHDLGYLASKFPEYAPELRATLKHYRLPVPASMTFPSPNTHSAPPRHRFSRPRPRSSIGIERVTSPTADPPPPYASEDPDPDGTAIRALRLAAQSVIGLGDVATLAQTSRVDIVDLAHRSRAELGELAHEARELQRTAQARSEIDVRGVERTMRPVSSAHTPQSHYSVGNTRDVRIPRRPAPRPPRPLSGGVPQRPVGRDAARQDALRRLERRPRPRPPRDFRRITLHPSLSTLRAHLSPAPSTNSSTTRSSRVSLPVLPPLDMGFGFELAIDFEREFEDWRDSSDSEHGDAGPDVCYPFTLSDVDAASVVATEG